jgi:hypothetical protein
MNIPDEYLHAIFPNRPFGELPDKHEDQQWSQIHSLYGLAVFCAQSYEDGMARFVIAAEEHRKRSGFKAKKIWRLPLGDLQKEYCRYCHLEVHHKERMAKAVQLRNSLVHKFYHRRINLLESAAGRDQVIQELHSAIRLFQQERDEMYWNLGLITGQPPL